MFFNFGFQEPMSVTLEQYIGNALVHSQQLSAPPEILKAQFEGLIQQLAQQSQPMKIKVVRYDEIWDEFEQKRKKIENSIEVKNWRDEE